MGYITITIISIVLGAAAAVATHKTGEKEGICKYENIGEEKKQ